MVHGLGKRALVNVSVFPDGWRVYDFGFAYSSDDDGGSSSRSEYGRSSLSTSMPR